MSIRFEPGSRPKTQDWLDQAAGVGIEFSEGSIQEFRFLALCETIWSHGLDTGITRMIEKLGEKDKLKGEEVFHADSV